MGLQVVQRDDVLGEGKRLPELSREEGALVSSDGTGWTEGVPLVLRCQVFVKPL